MRCSSPSREEGSAALEVLVLGVLLLVPLVYLVLTLASLQGAAFAAEGAARQAARALTLAAADADSGRAGADDAVAVALADWKVPRRGASVAVTCRPADCTAARSEVVVRVRVAAPLPLLPPGLGLDAPGTIPVEAAAVQRVSMFAAR